MNSNIISLPLGGINRKDYRYGLYFRKLTAPGGAVYTRPIIVLRNRFGDIVRFTRLHSFAEPFSGSVSAPLTSSSNEKLYHVCAMLNYILIEQYDRFGIDHIFHVNWEAINTFFHIYAYEQSVNGKFRSRETIERCVNNVADFFRRLKSKHGGYVLLEIDELFTEKTGFNRHGQQITKQVPLFQVKHIPHYTETFRELPTKAFKILLNLAFRYAPDIALAICLQAFAGLRAGEVCNVRQECSPVGSGIILTRTGDGLRKVEIDLTRELPMRSDGVFVGKIKRERKQCIYPAFLQAFNTAYGYHRAWLSCKDFEADYCPMFVNSKGLALTYKNYSLRFENLITSHFRKALLGDEDPMMRIYGQLLYENKLGTHALRHWYSVQLVLRGEGIAQIQYWRGDKSPESAFAYLQNKGDLISELEYSGGQLIDLLMDEGAKELGK
jgi:integrase